MRLLIPGTKATEVPVESAQRGPLVLEPPPPHDAVLKFYGFADPVRPRDAERAHQGQNQRKD